MQASSPNGHSPTALYSEKDLGEDAAWKRIQQNTFTRWCNEHLKTVNQYIYNLETDLSDGLLLISLVRILSGKDLGRFNKTPSFRSQKLENVSLVLKFLEREGIKIVNIDSTHIVDQNLKLILGLIWMLILHYSISMPVWDGEDGVGNEVAHPKETPKQRLLNWINTKVPQAGVSNFTNDWRDGRALGALVDSVAPGLCPDWTGWKPSDALANTTEAMDLADNWLGVPKLIEPHEMIDPNVDDQSVMTYLSQYPSARLREGAPLHGPIDMSKVVAFGPGLQASGNSAGVPTSFTVETFGAGRAVLNVTVTDPHGRSIPVEVVFNDDRKHSYSVHYHPKVQGTYKVVISFGKANTPASPYTVNIAPAKILTCEAWGRGLQPRGVRVGDSVSFKVATQQPDDLNAVEVKLLGPNGQAEHISRRSIDSKTNLFEYTPRSKGPFKVNVLCGGEHIVKSPFEVMVGPKLESRIRAFGPGLEGGMANLPCDFIVETNGEVGALGFSVEGPSEAKISCRDNGDGSADVTYLPTAPGPYVVSVLCQDEHIQGSPFVAEISQFQQGVYPSNVRCSGPGLEKNGVVVGRKAEFTVDAKQAGGKATALANVWCLNKFYAPVDVRVTEIQPGVLQCSYVAEETGKHTIIVTYANVAVAGSPFRVIVKEPLDPRQVRVYGPGVEHGVKSRMPTHFFVNVKEAGVGELVLDFVDEKNQSIDLECYDNHDGTFTGRYTAPRPGNYKLRVLYAGQEIPNSPFRLHVLPHADIGVIRVEGLDARVFVGALTNFTIDCRDLVHPNTEDAVSCILRKPSGVDEIQPVLSKHDGTYFASFVPEDEGVYHLDVRYEGVPIPNFPKAVVSQRGFDAARCKAYGPGLERAYVDIPAKFVVSVRGAGVGGLGISVEGPSEATIDVMDQKDGTCEIVYVPLDPGDYIISVKFADVHIPGSPFTVPCDHPVDAKKVIAFGAGLEPLNCRANVPCAFTVDAKKSGHASLSVDVTSDRGSGQCAGKVTKLPEIRERPQRLYEVIYYPPAEEGCWCTVSIKYGGTDIVSSPYRMKVLPTVEPKKVLISGTLASVPASIPCTFRVDTRQAGFGNMEILVLEPSGAICPVKVLDMNDGQYDVTFVPDSVGAYSIVVKYAGHEVPQSPYRLNAYAVGDASKCWIMERFPEAVVIGEEHCVTVNCAEAGEGRLTCRIIPAHATESMQPLDVEVDQNSDGTSTAYYTVRAPGEYRALLKFGGNMIPNGDCVFLATTADALPRAGLVNGYLLGDLPPVELWNIAIPGRQHIAADLIAQVIMPSRKTDLPTVKENHDGSVTIKYQPHEKGMHEMHITYQGTHVQGSPFHFHVDDVRDGYVTVYGPGLSYGTAGEPASFTICAKENATGGGSILGVGGLSVSVDGPAKAEIKVHDNKDGTCSVAWTPPAPGEYKLHIKYCDKEIHGSPFTAKIAGEGRKRAIISVGSTSEVSLKISEADIKGLSASIKSPSGIEEPCHIRKLDEGHLGISFTPREIGEHLVTVKKKATQQLLPNAPFRIHVSENEVGNSGKVKLFGPGIEQAITQQMNEFTVDTRGAGYGGLSISVEGPSKCEIQCKDNRDGTCNILYKPSEPGIYVLSAKFADHHCTGSPFTIKCQGAGIGTVTETLKTPKKQAPIVAEGDNCELWLKIPESNPMEVSAKLIPPEGQPEDVEIQGVSDNQYLCRFKPSKSGAHTVAVMHKGQHAGGSPFQFTVGTFKEGGAHKVRAGGPGLVRGEVNEGACFNLYTREAGPGNLSIAVEGPSKAQIEFKELKDGNCYVTYTVAKPGDYNVSIKFNDMHIPDSPFKVFVSPSSGEAKKLQVAAFPDTGLQLNKPVTFTVLTYGAKGHLDAKVVSPSGGQDDCFITPIDDETYAVRFVPRESGNHYVHIKLDGSHMRDSPFRVRVGGRDETDPTAVTVTGDGIKSGETGHKCEFILNTCAAGAGALAVTVDGPSKCTLDAYEVDVGYKVRYTPLHAGDYFITAKFNGVHIPNSPFKVKVTGKDMGGSGYNESSTVQINAVAKSGLGASHDEAPAFKGDATKVEAKGMGLKKAHVGRQNAFTLDTSKAGQDILFVAVMSRKGPIDEVYVKHMGRGSYTVNYLLKEKGPCFIYVKYGDKHIGGSPFSVEV